MSDTLLQRLRQYEGAQSQTTACYNGLRDEAADEIDRLREALEKAQGGVTDYAKQYVALRAENDRLLEALEAAREDVAHWGNYASDYSKEKHDLDGDLARIDAALAKEEEK